MSVIAIKQDIATGGNHTQCLLFTDPVVTMYHSGCQIVGLTQVSHLLGMRLAIDTRIQSESAEVPTR